MLKRRHSTSIDEIAARWVARCDRAALSATETAALEAWLAEDPRHFGAYARASAIFVRFDRAQALGKNFDSRSSQESPDSRLSPSRRHFLKGMGAAIGAAAAGVAGFAVLQDRGRSIETKLGEVLRVSLQDGSAVTLNSASRIVVEFQRARRLVRLVQGEALFDVAKDVLRPFVVEVAQDVVVAVGTSFTVQRALDGVVKVLVREGSVDFAHEVNIGKEQPMRLAANTMALAAPDRHVEVKALQPLEVGRLLAWRDGMISFNGDTLAHAASQFARYSDTRIVIDDPTVASRRVVGLYAAGNPEGFARAVALSMHLRVERRGNTVHLDRATK